MEIFASSTGPCDMASGFCSDHENSIRRVKTEHNKILLDLQRILDD